MLWELIFFICVLSYLNSLPNRTKGFNSLSPYAESTRSLDSLEDSVYKQINAYRADKGLPPLALDAQLTQQARLHSQLMASNQIPFNEEGIIKTSNTVANLIPYRGISTAIGVNQGYANPARANVDK